MRKLHRLYIVILVVCTMSDVWGQVDDPFHGIPVLCYHQVRDWKPSDSRAGKVYITPVASFKAQMKALKDNGYHSILPGDVFTKHNLPSKPFILTFDDGTEGQYSDANPVLLSMDFKAVYFIMTVTIGKSGYLSATQIRELANNGNVIGVHTWNHTRVTGYTISDWQVQLIHPAEVLKNITGQAPRYFAYPYGLWDQNAIEQLKKYNYIAAFRLSGRPDSMEPLYTVKRIIVDGNWNAAQLIKFLNTYKD